MSFLTDKRTGGKKMEQDMEYRRQLAQKYEREAAPLMRYLPWLEQSAGRAASENYSGQGIGESSMSFPVYDGTLMNFVREAGKTSLMDRNYRYIYTRNRINTPEDERKVIAKATLKEWDMLCGILSRYVLGGRTKGILWSQGVQERIFYLVLSKMKEILEYWNKP